MQGVVGLTTSAGGPVVVKSCAVGFVENGRILNSSLRFTNGVTITLMNNSTRPVSSVTIRGNYNGYVVTDTWSGKLAPGASVSFMRRYQQQPFAGTSADCRVLKATYADGTSWPT